MPTAPLSLRPQRPDRTLTTARTRDRTLPRCSRAPILSRPSAHRCTLLRTTQGPTASPLPPTCLDRSRTLRTTRPATQVTLHPCQPRPSSVTRRQPTPTSRVTTPPPPWARACRAWTSEGKVPVWVTRSPTGCRWSTALSSATNVFRASYVARRAMTVECMG